MYKLLVKTQQKRETKVKTKHFHISACFPNESVCLLTLFSSVVGDVELYFFKTPNHHDKAPRD